MITNSIRAFMVLFVAYCVVTHCIGCASPQVKEAAAVGSDESAQLRCVDKNETKVSIEACRANVRAQFGIVETIRDAGGDQ